MQTGYLVATVLDIVNNGMDLVLLDTSAEAHMPDTLAMPYRAMIRGSGIAGEKSILIDLVGILVWLEILLVITLF